MKQKRSKDPENKVTRKQQDKVATKTARLSKTKKQSSFVQKCQRQNISKQGTVDQPQGTWRRHHAQ